MSNHICKQSLLEWLNESFVDSTVSASNYDMGMARAYKTTMNEVRKGRFDVDDPTDVQRLRAALEQVRLEVIRHTTKHFSDHICRIANPVLNETEHTEIPCGRCGGSGFSGYGTGYDAVCDECGGAGFTLDISSTTEPAEVDRIKELWEASHLLTKQVGIIAVYRQGLVDACEALGISIQPMEENNE